MSIACPYCKAVLKVKALKAGRYTPQCPKCNNPFVVTVPDDETGTFKVEPMKKPAANNLPDTVRVPPVKPSTDKLPATSSRPAMKTAPPGADTDILVKGSSAVKAPPPRTPPAESDSVEDAAAAMLEGDDPDETPPPKSK